MKELKIREKASLVALLESHYTIKEKNFIDAIASNEEEKLNLTLMAYAIEAEPMNTSTNVPTTPVPTDPLKCAVINKLYSKLQFVKAVKEVKNLSLKEAKDLADQLLIREEETSEKYYSEPFTIGDSMNSKFTKKQWEEICERLWGDMFWKYV